MSPFLFQILFVILLYQIKNKNLRIYLLNLGVMNSIRTKIKNEDNFLYLLSELKKIGVLGRYICIGTSVDDTVLVDELEYFNDGSDDSYVGINVSLENDYLLNTYPKSFHYKNLLVSIDTKLDVKWGDISPNLFKKDDFLNEVKIMMKQTIK